MLIVLYKCHVKEMQPVFLCNTARDNSHQTQKHIHTHITGETLTSKRMNLLILGAHVHEGYSTHFVCVSAVFWLHKT